MAEKNYKSSTGVDEFYYATLDDADVATGTPERVEFLQNITVEMPQQMVRAYGDNKTAELAVSSGNITVSSQFHKVPMEDKVVLFGWESDTNGLTAAGSNDLPPYVACVFKKTYEDGSTEWVGLTKGKFMRPNVSAKTQEENKEFSSEEVSAEFMDREVTGFTKERSVIFGTDNAGENTNRDALFQAVFGQTYPTAPTGV